MMRLIVSVASSVCSVESTRWPVSAAVQRGLDGLESRISPTRMTSGSWRSAPRSAPAKVVRVDADLALVHDRPLVAVQELDRVLDRDDVRGRVRLMWSIIAASVVDLPEPVVPVNRIEAALLLAIFSSTCGSSSS